MHTEPVQSWMLWSPDPDPSWMFLLVMNSLQNLNRFANKKFKPVWNSKLLVSAYAQKNCVWKGCVSSSKQTVPQLKKQRAVLSFASAKLMLQLGLRSLFPLYWILWTAPFLKPVLFSLSVKLTVRPKTRNSFPCVRKNLSCVSACTRLPKTCTVLNCRSMKRKCSFPLSSSVQGTNLVLSKMFSSLNTAPTFPSWLLLRLMPLLMLNQKLSPITVLSNKLAWRRQSVSLASLAE